MSGLTFEWVYTAKEDENTVVDFDMTEPVAVVDVCIDQYGTGEAALLVAKSVADGWAHGIAVDRRWTH